MGTILSPAAQRINADTAGNTRTGTEANAIDAGPTATEFVRRLIPTASGALDSIFRMEPTPATEVSVSPVVASSATRGPNGGMIPAALSALRTGMAAPAPGPGPTLSPMAKDTSLSPGNVGEPITTGTVAKDTAAAVGSARTTAASALSSLRRRLGV